MKNKKITQRGQALVLIALAMVGLVGFTALAIDGGSVFSDRRHSQNTSDTAAYAAALAKIREESNWQQFAIDRAVDNGYSAADGVTEVDVHSCDELPLTVNGYTLTCKGLPAGAIPSEYVYVHIKSLVKLFFAPVVGWREITNHTDAVVLAAGPKETTLFPGFAIVSTMLGCPPYNHDPFVVTGSSGTTIVNAGILVNSDCTFPQPAYDQGGSSEVDTDTGVCVVGAAQSTNTDPPPTTDCSPIDVNIYTLPNPECDNYPDGDIVENSPGEYTAIPGRYGPTFNYDSIDDVNPNGNLRLLKGIYCFYNGIDLNAQWNITTDLNNNGEHDSISEGVFFFVPDGGITFNGSSYLDIHAVDSTAQDFPADYVNYLIYVPPTNPNEIYITGANGSNFTGTILAPNSYIRLNGGSGTVGLNSQIIGYAVAIEGSGTLEINYNAADTPITTYNPSLKGIE
jgi:Flp pilus assembly protein TadG